VAAVEIEGPSVFKITGYKTHGVWSKEFKIKRILERLYFGKVMRHSGKNFVVCISNKGYPASLELRKLYQSIPDDQAIQSHQIRVIDESGEDYLYPEEFFVPVNLPQSTERAVLRAHD
jgi:hypothetical protein